jgi:phosphoribosylformylglycinamidine synthase
VLQVRVSDRSRRRHARRFARGPVTRARRASRTRTRRASGRVRIASGGRAVLDEALSTCAGRGRPSTHEMQRLRDDPACADEEHDRIGSRTAIRGSPAKRHVRSRREDVAAPVHRDRRAPARSPSCASRASTGRSRWPRAFDRAGFEAVDVHMSDHALEGRVSPYQDFRGLRGLRRLLATATYARRGRRAGPRAMLFHASRARRARAPSWAATDTFALGVCNGCQMMSNLKRASSPARQAWPRIS